MVDRGDIFENDFVGDVFMNTIEHQGTKLSLNCLYIHVVTREMNIDAMCNVLHA